MGQFVAIRNGGKTDENGALRFLRQASLNGQGTAQTGGMLVSQHATPNNSVDVAIGDLIIAYQDYLFYTWIDAIYNVTPITANSSGNPRIDSVVGYVDLAVVSAASNNNPGALKFIIVAGTPAGSPVAPNGTTIQAAVGAGNPYYVLANMTVVNGFTSGSQMLNASISDQRKQFLLGSSSKFGFSVPYGLTVANDVSWNPQVPQAQTVTTLSGHCKTAPTGQSLIVLITNITQGNTVATLTISAGSQDATTTSMTNASLHAGDVLRVDVSQIGNSVGGADLSLILY